MATRQWQIPLRPFVRLNISPLLHFGQPSNKIGKELRRFHKPPSADNPSLKVVNLNVFPVVQAHTLSLRAPNMFFFAKHSTTQLRC